MKRDAKWIAKEAELWRRLMDPRLTVEDSWVAYDEWINHR